MNKYLHRILFKIGFCKEEARTVLNDALCIKGYYMCPRISNIIYIWAHLDFDYPKSRYAHYMSAYGFTFKNYKKFIEKNYPSLIKYLNNGEYTGPWLNTSIKETPSADIELSRESKDAFLKYLIRKL